MKILVSGASGHFGRTAIKALLNLGIPNEDIRAGAHNPKKARDLSAQGIEVVRFDYDDFESLQNALRGVTHFLMVSVSQNTTPLDQHDLAIDAAQRAEDLEILAFTSVYHASTSEIPLAPIFRAAEKRIIERQIPHIFLRNNAYAEMYMGYIFQGIQNGVIVSSAGDAKISAACREDLAQAAAHAIVNPIYYGKTLELIGDTPICFGDLARIASQYRKEPVSIENISLEQSRQILQQSGLKGRDLEVMSQLERVEAENKLFGTDHTLHSVLGKSTKTIEELAADYLE
ncbi:MAG: NmrA family NAD(P)-binding protein [Atopobiaceae bacterium]|jgi:NAD(P)H dehydrogenase (quinone)